MMRNECIIVKWWTWWIGFCAIYVQIRYIIHDNNGMKLTHLKCHVAFVPNSSARSIYQLRLFCLRIGCRNRLKNRLKMKCRKDEMKLWLPGQGDCAAQVQKSPICTFSAACNQAQWRPLSGPKCIQIRRKKHYKTNWKNIRKQETWNWGGQPARNETSRKGWFICCHRDCPQQPCAEPVEVSLAVTLDKSIDITGGTCRLCGQHTPQWRI